jgi:hypothetical protein
VQRIAAELLADPVTGIRHRRGVATMPVCCRV